MSFLNVSGEIGGLHLSGDFTLRDVILRRAEQTASTARSVLSDNDVNVENVGRASNGRLRFEASAQEGSGTRKICSKTGSEQVKPVLGQI